MEEDFNRCDMCRAKLCGFSPPAITIPTTALLPCLHAFCPTCKAKCKQASLNQQTLICQICHTECFRSHVLDLPNPSECAVRRCESAVCPDKHQATTKCTICNEALCADCSLAHQRVTATSSHFLQTLCPAIPNCIRCRVHNNMKIVSICQCGSYLCMTCIASRLHENPPHMVTPLSQLSSARIDEGKIMSSTMRETTHIDCSLSVIQLRKNALAERVVNLKKEVGNQVVQICQAVMRRGNDLLRSLDAVHFYKGREYDKLRDELVWQKRRFSRINSYASHVKDFDDPSALVVMKQFLENCIRVIKTKKISSERNLNGLQRPATVQFKPDTEHIVANIGQWGRVFAEVDDLGTLKTIEVTPTPPSSNLLDVPLFETSTNGLRAPNIYAQRSCLSGTVGQNTPNPVGLRAPVSQEHVRILQQQQQQQQLRVQELAARQMQNARRPPFPQSSFLGPLLTENPQRPGSIQLPGAHRYPTPYPCASGIAAPERLCAPPYTIPVGQILSYPNQRMFLPNSLPSQQPAVTNLVSSRQPAVTNLVDALNHIHRVPNVLQSNSQQGIIVSGTSALGNYSSPILRRSGESGHQMQAGRCGSTNMLSVSSSGSTSTFTNISVTQSTSSAVVATSDTHSVSNSNTSMICASTTDTPVTHSRSGIWFNSAVLNPSITPSVQQSNSSGTPADACVSSPPPKDPEPAPVKVTVRIKKINNDEVANVSAVCNKESDQNKPADPEQPGDGTKRDSQAGSSADNDESRWDDYCYVCQQGCDEKTGSLGCCARCPRVFHNYCHIPAIKEQMENLPDEWACSLCVEVEPLQENMGTMGQRERLLCSKVLLICHEKHLDVEPFCQPVPRSVTSYHAIIKQPMDFSTIARRLKEKSRDSFTNVAQFIQCMNLVFENCSTFNAPDDEIAKAGRSVYQIYSKAVKDYLPCMKSQVWLYVNRYSENRHAGLLQKEQNAQASTSSTLRTHESVSAEPMIKKPRKEVKSEFSEVT